MGTGLQRAVEAEALCRALGRRLVGPSLSIARVAPLDSLDERGLSFVLKKRKPAEGLRGTVFGPESLATSTLSVIASQDARLDFIRAQHWLDKAIGFAEPPEPPQLHPSVRLGRNVVLENGVVIGEGTTVGHNSVIHANTRIGRFCEIRSGAVIGDSGFGFERDAEGRPWKMIHLGGVVIGDHVEVGSGAAIARGSLGDTVIEDYVKMDNHVHVAHNCHIGRGSILTACVEISGSVKVGANVWIAPNSTLVQKITVGDGAFIGIGSVVSHNVEAGVRVFGNPARKIVTPSAPTEDHV